MMLKIKHLPCDHSSYLERHDINDMRESTFIVSTIIPKRAIEINAPSSLLIEGNTITDSQGISEHFKNFFTSICQDLQKHFAPTKEHFSDHVKAPNKIPGPILEFKESV